LGGTPSAPAGNGGSIVFLDANNDGYLDIYMNDDTTDVTTDRLRLNDKDNTFTDDDAETSGDGRGAGAGDYDNDYDVDLIVGTQGNLYSNDGTSSFTSSTIPANDEESLMFVDIDADGDLDVWHPGATYLWSEYTGGTSFTGRSGLPDGNGNFNVGTATNGEGGTAADVNNDGYVDLMWANEDNAVNPGWVIFLGGKGTTTPRNYTLDSDPSGGVNVTGLPATVSEHENMDWAWGDYDNDGDMDLYVSGITNEGLYENDGTGVFSNVTTSSRIRIQSPDGAAWGDYDNDGYLDLIIAQEGGQSKLYRLFLHKFNGLFETISRSPSLSESKKPTVLPMSPVASMSATSPLSVKVPSPSFLYNLDCPPS